MPANATGSPFDATTRWMPCCPRKPRITSSTSRRASGSPLSLSDRSTCAMASSVVGTLGRMRPTCPMMRCVIAATSVSATQPQTCHATRFRCSRQRGGVALLPLPTIERTSVRVDCHAGHSPKTTPASTIDPIDAASTGAFTSGRNESEEPKPTGRSIVRKSTSVRSSQTASAPPAHTTIADSISCSRISRQREAPSALRTAVSSERDVPFASVRFARLLQAISNNMPTLVRINPAMTFIDSDSGPSVASTRSPHSRCCWRSNG
jgi:hypothetical protein